MNTLEEDYPCVGVCMIDANGYCIGCGRPSLPEPEIAQVDEAAATDPKSAAEPDAANRAE